MICPQRTACLGDFHDGIRQGRRLHFSGPPGELHSDSYALLIEIISRNVDKFGGNDAVRQIFCFLVGRCLGNRQHPAHLAATLFSVGEISYGHYFQAAFEHPVKSGQTRIKHAVLDVSSHFLGTNQHAFDIRICGRRGVRPAIGVDIEACSREELQRGLL